MKAIGAALQGHLEAELTTLAYLVKLTRGDGVVKAFTTHDRDLEVDGVTYKADGAFKPSAIESGASLAADNLEVAGILESTEIAGEDICAGLYDHARVDIYLCNWADAAMGVVQLRRGWIGEVKLQGGRYVAELRGFHDLLQRQVGHYYTAECRHDLGDTRCGVGLGAVTVSGTVTSVVDQANFSDSARSEAEDWFAYGTLSWTSGANVGLAMEVRGWDAALKRFRLWLPMPRSVQVGDGYTVTPGCDKRFMTCGGKFFNAVNFGGFPHLPGVDRILAYPDGK